MIELRLFIGQSRAEQTSALSHWVEPLEPPFLLLFQNNPAALPTIGIRRRPTGGLAYVGTF